MSKPVFNDVTEIYFYNNQLKKLAIQFMSIFADIKVSVGKNDESPNGGLMSVPIHYGSMDRVVGALMAKNSTNTLLRLPAFSAKIIGMEYATDKVHGTDTIDRHVMLKRGGIIPDDLKVLYRLMPIPYDITFELAFMTTNTQHSLEILEQICLLFNPSIQIQTSDAAMDWTKITNVELKSISFDEEYPSGQNRRLIPKKLQFSVTAYLSAPVNLRDEIVKKINIRLATISNSENVHDVVSDVDRQYPEYQKLFDIEDLKMPDQ